MVQYLDFIGSSVVIRRFRCVIPSISLFSMAPMCSAVFHYVVVISRYMMQNRHKGERSLCFWKAFDLTHDISNQSLAQVGGQHVICLTFPFGRAKTWIIPACYASLHGKDTHIKQKLVEDELSELWFFPCVLEEGSVSISTSVGTTYSWAWLSFGFIVMNSLVSSCWTTKWRLMPSQCFVKARGSLQWSGLLGQWSWESRQDSYYH